jgi:hypothetical protein
VPDFSSSVKKNCPDMTFSHAEAKKTETAAATDFTDSTDSQG